MPVFQVWKAKNTIIMKRFMATGYADVPNQVFYKPNSFMIFGDSSWGLFLPSLNPNRHGLTGSHSTTARADCMTTQTDHVECGEIEKCTHANFAQLCSGQLIL